MNSFLKLGVAATSIAFIALGWYAVSMNNIIRQKNEQIRELKETSAKESRMQAFLAQSECTANAQKFLISRAWKPSDGFTYDNHFNSRVNKCFILISEYLFKDDFRSINLYDAVEGRHYASYNGHDICEVAIIKKSRKCALDSGSIWFDGNDSRGPADFTVGFRGYLFGGGAGDENTQKMFLDRVRSFMSQ